MNPQDEPNVPLLYYRPEQAAQVLSISRAHLYNLMRAGKIESFKLGRARMIPAQALYALRDQRNPAHN